MLNFHSLVIFSPSFSLSNSRWSDGAKVLFKLAVRGRPTSLGDSKAMP